MGNPRFYEVLTLKDTTFKKILSEIYKLFWAKSNGYLHDDSGGKQKRIEKAK